VRGELKLAAADSAALRAGLAVVLMPPAGGSMLRSTVETVRPHGRNIVARLRDIDDLETARELHGATIFAERTDLPKLSKNEYREADLAGMRVVDSRLGLLGDVREVRRYPSCDMLVIGERKLLVPMLLAYGLEVDVTAREIRVTLPDGFADII
jgi:16S rRNA processing protein RimM